MGIGGENSEIYDRVDKVSNTSTEKVTEPQRHPLSIMYWSA